MQNVGRRDRDGHDARRHSREFAFTVRDDATAAKINALSGKRVVLSYQQHKFIPTTCFGETEYFVNGVREMVDQPSASPASQGQLQTPR